MATNESSIFPGEHYIQPVGGDYVMQLVSTGIVPLKAALVPAHHVCCNGHGCCVCEILKDDTYRARNQAGFPGYGVPEAPSPNRCLTCFINFDTPGDLTRHLAEAHS